MHASLSASIPALVLAHVVSAFAFALFHGPSAYAMWALRREHAPARVATLLDLSRWASVPSGIAMAILAGTGALLATAEHAWSFTWVWASVVVFLAVSIPMSYLAARPLNDLRDAVGAAWFDGRRLRPATGIVDEPGLKAALKMVRARLGAATVLGVGGLATLIWLMVVRPA